MFETLHCAHAVHSSVSCASRNKRYLFLSTSLSDAVLVMSVWCNSVLYDVIYLLTAVRFTPGGSSTVHIYTQTIHRTEQLTGWKAVWDSSPDWSK
jgi:hypothetical protein